MTDRCEAYRNCRITTSLSSLKVLNLDNIPGGFTNLQMSKIRCVNYAFSPNPVTINIVITYIVY